MSSNASKKSFIDSYKNSISLIGDKLRDFDTTRKNSNSMVWISFSVIITFMIILGYIIFFYNPYNILNYVQVPLIFIYLLLFGYILLFVFKTASVDMKYFNFSSDLFTHTKTFLKLLLIVVCIFIAGIVSYNIIKSIFFKSIQVSSVFTIVIMLLILSIINSLIDVNSSKDPNPILEILKNVVFYIPCLISDAIDFAKEDYKNTPTTTFILFVILVIIILLYASYYLLNNLKNTNDIVLVDKAVNLDKLILSLSKRELNEKIVLSRPFYERELYKLQNKKDTIYDISLNPDIAPTNVIPSYADKLTRVLYKNKIEGFTNVISDETIPIHLKISDYNRYILQQAMWENPSITKNINDMTDSSSNDIGKYVQSIIDTQTSAMSVYKSVMLYLATFNNSNFSKHFVQDLDKNNYHYSISCWIYLNRENADPKVISKSKNVIIKYGNRPSLYFNIATKELTLETIDSNNNIIVHYRTNSILYQRWNHIVINNNYGTTDLFINGNLVGSYKNIVDYSITKDELFQVGALTNNILGGIARVCYYQLPLSLTDVKTQYINKPSF
jgi:hypothetical protein